MFTAFAAFDHSVMAALQSLYEWGGEVLDQIFLGITFLGEETFVILLLIAIYWCWNKKLGEYILFSLYLAMSTNGLLKDLIRRPRPFLNADYADLRYVSVDTPLVNTADLGSSFSFPSGHSQTAGSVYGALGRKRGAGGKLICFLLILLVMASRIYLGVHYPTDTIVGALLGLVCAWVGGALFYRLYEHKILLMGAAVVLSMVTLYFDFTAGTIKIIGLGVGAVIGMALEDAIVDFRNEGGFFAKLLRLVIGFAIIMGIRLGLKMVFPDLIWFHALRYALMGLAGTFLWPWAFTKIGL